MKKKKKVRLQDIADKTGYSIATISHFINKTRKIEESTQQIIIEAIEELGYKLPSNRSYSKGDLTIGVIISDIRVDFFTDLIRELEDFAYDNDINIIFMDSEENSEKEIQCIEHMINHGVKGIILAPTNTKADHSKYAQFPIVQIDRRIDSDIFDFVGIDNLTACYLITRKLFEANHNNVGFITFNDDNYCARERNRGYKLACIDNDKYNPSHILTIPFDAGIDGKNIKTFLLENSELSAVVCTSTNITNEVIDAIYKLGDKTNITKISTFDNNKWLDLLKIPVDSILQPINAIATTAVNLLLNKINNEEYSKETKKIFLNCETIQRN
ncbi:MAG: LacI family DNA-binding transcriptional regulator [Pleomorphochaeta sp.]